MFELPFPSGMEGMMTEKLLQFIWRFQYFNRNDLSTTNGEKIQVLLPGSLNQHQGPDFSEARIKIGNTVFAGSVELHLNTSDWDRHGHQHDSNYRNVILHVVYRHDRPLENHLPVLELEPRVSALLLHQYERLMHSTAFIPCSGSITQVRELTWISWKERLLAERLARKAHLIFSYLEQNNTHWEASFWWLLARTFGMKVNAESFEAVAQSLPIALLAKHKNQVHQLEALLLGQAGLLQNQFSEEYPKLLQREYEFLKKKYQLHPVALPVHFLRMRPGNFPTIRLAQLAMLVHTSAHLFSKILETENLHEVKTWLDVTANDYWHYHYRFDEPSPYKKKNTGNAMIESIIINTLAPALFAYGLYHKEEKFKTKALLWLEQAQAESNNITEGFKQAGITAKSAFDTQALLELKNEYCQHRRCLECSVGNYLMKK